MSDKSTYEDKAEASPLPRTLTTLLDVTQELRQAVQRQRTEEVRSLLGDLDKAWRNAQHENIHVHSFRGDQENCIRFAAALNDANQALYAGQALLMQ